MKFLSMCKAVALTVLLSIAALPAVAQSLTTTYASNNSQDGVLFDLTPTTDLTVDSFDAHLEGGEQTLDVEVYWRNGTVEGNQTNSEGWTLLGSAQVVSQGEGNPTPVPIGGLALSAGQTYGIFLRVVENDSLNNLQYTNIEGPTTIANADLALTGFYGKGNGDPLLSGSTFEHRLFNGTVYYSLGIAPATTCASEGYTYTKLLWCQNICEKGYTGSTLAMWIRRWTDRYRTLPYCAIEPQPAPALR